MRGRNGMGVTIPVNRMAPRRIQRRTSATPDSVRGRVESRLNLHSPFSAHQSIHLQVIDPIVRMRSVVCVPRLVDLIQIKADSLTTMISRWKKGRRVPSAMEVSQPCSNITTKHPIAWITLHSLRDASFQLFLPALLMSRTTSILVSSWIIHLPRIDHDCYASWLA